jgi:hypothetical protein
VSTSPLGAIAGEAMTLSAALPIAGVTNVLSVNLTNVTVSATSSGGTGVFGYPDQFMPSVGTGTTQRVGGGDLDLSSALGATVANSTLLGGPFLQGQLINSFNTELVNAIAPAINTSAIPFIGSSLGLEIGGADVGANDLNCSGPILVN